MLTTQSNAETQRRRGRQIRFSLRLGVSAFVFLVSAYAYDWKSLKPQGYVSDFAGVVDAGSKARLEEFCARVKEKTGVEMALVTVKSLEGDPIELAANDLFRAWGIGQKGQNNGILLMLAIAERRDRLEVGYGLEPEITDGLAGSVLREMRPALRQSQYGQALFAAAQTIGLRIAAARGINLDTSLPRTVPRDNTDIPWWLILVGLFLLIWLMRAGSRGGGGYGGGGGGILPGLILGGMMGRSGWGGRGGGGFGGFDSGDGFGGFGGGDSGGGGASSGW